MTQKQNNMEPESRIHIPPDDNKNYFYSYDIGLVGYLLSLKYELASLDKEARGKVLFRIKRTSEIDADIKNYWAFDSLVDAQSYFNQIKRLKNQIFSY